MNGDKKALAEAEKVYSKLSSYSHVQSYKVAKKALIHARARVNLKELPVERVQVSERITFLIGALKDKHDVLLTKEEEVSSLRVSLKEKGGEIVALKKWFGWKLASKDKAIFDLKKKVDDCSSKQFLLNERERGLNEKERLFNEREKVFYEKDLKVKRAMRKLA
jgi:hypothetical protein